MTRKQFILWSGLFACVSFAVPAQGQLEELIKKVSEKVSGTPAVPKKLIAYFEIDGPLAETPINLPPLLGEEPPMSMKSLLERLKEARIDPNVVAIAVDLQNAQLGLAQIEEIHAALRRFAAVEKEVYVHAESLTTTTFAAACGASRLSMVPTGDLWLVGMYGEAPYLRGALDKLGCTPDFLQFEAYKTAAEPLLRKEPSPESQEMSTWLFDGLYEQLIKEISVGRNIPAARVRELIDGGPYPAEEALEAGLIDAVEHREAFVSGLKKRYGGAVDIVTDYAEEDPFDMPSDNIFAAFELMMKMLNPKPKSYTRPSVAIVYVEGAIMTGESKPSLFGSSEGAFSTTIRRALEKAADDNTVRAVVLRIDSPGGSALASEIILEASRRVADRKPLIVSMGNVAGSGGYYVTCAADAIFADASTITASIGVIGGKIVTTDMWNKIGINWHARQRGKMAAMLSSASRFSDAERAKMHDYMGDIYEVFKGHVVESRKGKLTKPIEQIAGGRVFTGAQALELGLIDQIGGLDDAITFAAKQAGLGEYEIRVIPEPKGLFDLFSPEKEDHKYLSMPTRTNALSFADQPAFQAILPMLAKVDPLRFRAVLNALVRLELIHTEGVIVMMPEEWVVR